MVKDAELHADEDRKALELVNARNSGEALAHSVAKNLKEHGDKISADEKSAIESALKSLEDILKTGTKEDIDAKVAALSEVAHKLAEKMYGAEQQAAGGAPGAEAAGQQAPGAGRGKDDNVVDAEFEEVKEAKK